MWDAGIHSGPLLIFALQFPFLSFFSLSSLCNKSYHFLPFLVLLPFFSLYSSFLSSHYCPVCHSPHPSSELTMSTIYWVTELDTQFILFKSESDTEYVSLLQLQVSIRGTLSCQCSCNHTTPSSTSMPSVRVGAGGEERRRRRYRCRRRKVRTYRRSGSCALSYRYRQSTLSPILHLFLVSNFPPLSPSLPFNRLHTSHSLNACLPPHHSYSCPHLSHSPSLSLSLTLSPYQLVCQVCAAYFYLFCFLLLSFTLKLSHILSFTLSLFLPHIFSLSHFLLVTLSLTFSQSAYPSSQTGGCSFQMSIE
jgi:hypothetical protein